MATSSPEESLIDLSQWMDRMSGPTYHAIHSVTVRYHPHDDWGFAGARVIWRS